MILDFHAAHMSEFVANDPDEAIALFHAALEAQAQRAVREERERCAKEAKMQRWWLWAAIMVAGGEIRIPAKLCDDSPLEGTITREDDLTTCDRILRATR